MLTLIHIRLVYSIHLRIVVSDTYKNHCWKQPTLEIAAEEEASQLRHNPHNPILVALIALIFCYFIVVLSIWLLNSTHLLPAQFYSDTYKYKNCCWKHPLSTSWQCYQTLLILPESSYTVNWLHIWPDLSLLEIMSGQSSVRGRQSNPVFYVYFFLFSLSPLDGSDIGNTIHLICSFVLSLECTTPTLQCQCCTLNAVITPERAWSPLFFYHIVHTKERKCHQINRLKWKVIAIAAKIKYLSELLQALRFL